MVWYKNQVKKVEGMSKQKVIPYLPNNGATGTEENNSPIYQATNDCNS